MELGLPGRVHSHVMGTHLVPAKIPVVFLWIVHQFASCNELQSSLSFEPTNISTLRRTLIFSHFTCKWIVYVIIINHVSLKKSVQCINETKTCIKSNKRYRFVYYYCWGKCYWNIQALDIVFKSRNVFFIDYNLIVLKSFFLLITLN